MSDYQIDETHKWELRAMYDERTEEPLGEVRIIVWNLKARPRAIGAADTRPHANEPRGPLPEGNEVMIEEVVEFSVVRSNAAFRWVKKKLEDSPTRRKILEEMRDIAFSYSAGLSL